MQKMQEHFSAHALLTSFRGAADFRRRFDGIAALIGACALMALFRYKASVIPVIAVCDAAGLLFLFLKPRLIQYGVFL